MKKFFAAAAIAIFMMTSCSDEDTSENNNNTTDAVLLKKMVETYEDGSTLTTTYTYYGNKLVRENDSDGYRTEYSYGNGKLVGIKSYDDNNLLTGEDVLTYDTNGRLTARLDYWYPLEEGDEGWVERYVYSYNQNGTISFQIFMGDMDSQTELWDEGTYTLSNGNIVNHKSEGNAAVNMFDSKNHPMKNIYAYSDFTLIYEMFGGVNNLLSYTQTGADPEHMTKTFTYNSDNYPVTSSEDWDGDITTTQYFYE